MNRLLLGVVAGLLIVPGAARADIPPPPGQKRVTLDHKIDPETSDEWVSVSVAAKGEIVAIADAYDAYTTRWLRESPPRTHGKVRLSLVAE